MSTIQSVYAALQQEGYRPLIGEEGIHFKYYGQQATFKCRTVGPVTVAELDCLLPRPAPAAAQAQAFGAEHPLSRLSGRGGQALLTLETMLTSGQISVQLAQLLQLLDQYTADVVFGTAQAQVSLPETLSNRPSEPPLPHKADEAAPETAPALTPPETQSANTPQVAASQEFSSSFGPQGELSAQSVAHPAELSPPWQATLRLMHERFHPLARALAALGAPVPDEVQMDMMQGHQVKGTAIMMWGSPPSAVVVCEQGQMIPSGYQGGTWFKHQTPEQIAQETLAHLRAARLT